MSILTPGPLPNNETPRPDHLELGPHLRDHPYEQGVSRILLWLGGFGLFFWTLLAFFATNSGEFFAVFIFVVFWVLSAYLVFHGLRTRRTQQQSGATASIYRDGVVIHDPRGDKTLRWHEFDREKLKIDAGARVTFYTKNGDTAHAQYPADFNRLIVDIEAQIHREQARRAYQHDPDGPSLRQKWTCTPPRAQHSTFTPTASRRQTAPRCVLMTCNRC
jgi:hypothetical protein